MSTEEERIAREQKLAAHAGDDRVVHWTEYLKEKEQSFAKYALMNTGFKTFNEKIGGFLSSEVTTLSGRTGEGKTLFAETIIHSLMKINPESAKVCIFSFETAPEFILQKYADWETAPLHLPLRLECMNPAWLYDRVLEAKIKYGCRIFVFDHLHFLIDMAFAQNMSLNIGGFMRSLKQEIAVGLNVCCILIAHQGMLDKRRPNSEPTIDDIRDSSMIGQESDNVCLVWRRKDFSRKDIEEIESNNPLVAAEIIRRTNFFKDPSNPYANQFAMVQISKARRTGTFRWNKLFQKVGNFLEEV